MVLKKISLVLLILITIYLCAGCWDAIDINEKDIVTTAGIDRKNNNFYFYSEIPNLSLSKAESEKSEHFSIIIGKGETFVEARKDHDSKLDKPLFFGASRIIVMTKELAEYGMDKYMYRLQNVIGYRKAMDVITTSEELKDLYAVEPENNQSVGFALEQTISNLEKRGEAIQVSASEILEWIYSKNVCFIMPNIDIREEQLALTGYSVIHDGKYHGFIPIEDANGLICFLNDHAKLNYIVPFGDNEATVEVKLTKRIITPYYSDKQVEFQTEFVFDAIVIYLDDNVVFDETAAEETRKNLQKMVLEDLITTVRKSKYTFRCEYLEFDEAFRIGYPDVYEKMDWSEEFSKSKVSISVKASLDPGGMMDFAESGR